ncbi:FAD:protein FMN transferase [Nakamurella deserti]|uniref:FAD:protein FMN transferase n=1 Tax=Nakamurella deserti TaxID=2164074 RepID=UPI00197C39C9|nr:FAD:protein FMN transferase [Nakamurella deserti]
MTQLMGMPVSLALRGRHDDTAAGRRAWAAVTAQLRRVDRMFSTYRDDSPVSRLGRGELTEADSPAEVREVLELGRAAAEQSGGAFSMWLPDSTGQIRFDPSGVVKGWAVQRASAALTALDDTDFCLSAGGDIVCRVADPDRPDWRIGVEHPLDPRRLIAVVPVRTGGIATSGTAHRGRHLRDGRTGRPVTGVASVTVIGPDLTWADLDATAAYARGADAADWLRTRIGRSALVVWPDATTTVVVGRLPDHS